ncbi:MAG: helix-turn-helix domain-containing protein [Patescibacteria group bacterium]|nr:helix-turn-helix domain-containing protein [Patescibacteria group bacterium]
MEDIFCTVREISETTGYPIPKVLRMIKKGKIQAHKQGWFWLIPRKELDRLVEELGQTS